MECLICLGELAQPNSSKGGFHACSTCFKVFHMPCIREWASSAVAHKTGAGVDSANPNSFRCPGCQCPQAVQSLDNERCFCGKQPFEAVQFNPSIDSAFAFNSCGNTCGRVRNKVQDSVSDSFEQCPHPCTAVCHMGPCEQCARFASKTCHCGKMIYQTRCGSYAPRKTCDSVCGKLRSCGAHSCDKQCHAGDCSPCTVAVQSTCFCRCTQEDKLCGSGIWSNENGEMIQKFACISTCNKQLSCGNHFCTETCHPGECAPCKQLPSAVKTCPCGSQSLSSMGVVRYVCTDPIPTCNSVCDKLLVCGHHCLNACHALDEACRCVGKKILSCDCGKSNSDILCLEFVQNTKVHVKCNSLCKTLRNCGKHQCATRCCVLKGDSSSHECPLPCNKLLQCGNHRCSAPCHSGYCGRCLEASFDEISCNCGDMRLIPPIPCGTSLSVTCAKRCALPPGPCGHANDHPCHSGPCPPCTYPVEILCIRGHQSRSFPCSQEVQTFSCNLPCGQKLQNCQHCCQMPCHEHDGFVHEQSPCNQPCSRPITACTHGHKCKSVCRHNGWCSGVAKEPGVASQCLMLLSVTCDCGALVSFPLTCSALDSVGLKVVSAGFGSREHEVRVACSNSRVQACVDLRVKKYLKTSFTASTAGAVVSIKQPGMEALGWLDPASGKVSSVSVLAARLASDAHGLLKSETNARTVTHWDAVWFVNMPNAPDFGRREIAGFIKSRVLQKFDFLNHASTGGGSGSTPASGSNLPELPQTVATDLRTRRAKQTKNSSNNRDHVAYFMGRYLTVAEAMSLVTGREGWVVPLTIKVRQAASGSNLDVEQLSSALPSVTVEEEGPVVPQPPLNAFEMLENSEPVIVERPFDPSEEPSSEDVGTSKKSKKKKKPKAENAVAAVVEKTVEKIENPQVQVKAANLCAHSACKEKLGVMGQYCQFCDRKYCLAHRFPEVHSEICGTKKKNLSQTSFKNDARLGIAIGKKETQGGKSGSLAKEREDAKKRLAERIKNARK